MESLNLPIRPLPTVLQPVLGEAFKSYLERLAASHNVPLDVISAYTGLVDEGGSLRHFPGFGVALTQERLAVFAAATRLDSGAVSEMLLSRYCGTLIDVSDVNPRQPDTFRRAAAREWAYFSGSHFCPTCLADSEGAWLTRWKFPWSFACVRHQQLLLHECPECEQRAAGARSNGILAPAFLDQVPKPGCCTNTKGMGIADVGRAARPCGYDLSQASTATISHFPSVVAVQEELNARMSGGASGAEFFREMRSVAALILHCADSEDLGDLPVEAAQAFHDFEASRNEKISQRSKELLGRRGPRNRLYIGAPTNAALMAAVLPLAFTIVAQTNKKSLIALFETLSNRIQNISGRYRWQLSTFFKLSPRLATAFETALARTSGFNRRAGRLSAYAESDSNYGFNPEHVPELFPEQFFRPLAHCFSGVLEVYARRFCSMALVKLLGDYTWGQAAEAIGLPAAAGGKRANRDVMVLNKNGAYDDFARQLHTIAQQYGKVPLINYRARRQALATFDDIPWSAWVKICRDGGISPGERGSRSRYAAAWLWAQLTGSDWRRAPSLKSFRQDSAREVYRQFERKYGAALSAPLLQYGNSIVLKDVSKAL